MPFEEMSDPANEQREPDQLELKAETIKDLELEPDQSEQVLGGACAKTGIVPPTEW